MNFIVKDNPCLLLETAELVYALVNDIATEKMTCDGPYAIAVSELETIRQTVCAGLSSADEELRFYFHGVAIEGEAERKSCLAFCILNFDMIIGYYEIRDAIQALKSEWRRQTKPFWVTGISPFGICCSDAVGFTSFAAEMDKLPVPQLYKSQLVEVFVAFEQHLDRLETLLSPLAERLKPLLEPWVTQAAPRREEWRRFFLTEKAVPFMLNKSGIDKTEDIPEQIILSMRYISPGYVPLRYKYAEKQVLYHMGVVVPPGSDAPQDKAVLEKDEYTALRLLSNPDRITMLNAMLHEPMSGPALMQKYGFHSGSVFRDLNSLYNAGLLSICVQDGKNTYRTNFPAIHKLVIRMLQAIDPDFQE